MFLLDANVFITPYRSYYSPVLAPGFWDWLADTSSHPDMRSPAAIKQEILNGKRNSEGNPDLLSAEIDRLPDGFWVREPDEAVASYVALTRWVLGRVPQYKQSATEEFLDSPDYHLVALGHYLRATVVTFETPSPEAIKRVKIPDACLGVGVKYTEPFELFRAQKLCLQRGAMSG